MLDENKSPSRKVNELDNRGSHFYLSLYWAKSLATQAEDLDFAAEFSDCAEFLEKNESAIINELNAIQGQPMDIGGYYHPNDEEAADAMRPSSIFNSALSDL